jgi:hypothetical protein
LLFDSHSLSLTVKNFVEDHDLASTVSVGIVVVLAIVVLLGILDDLIECVVLSVIHLMVLGELDDDWSWYAVN